MLYTYQLNLTVDDLLSERERKTEGGREREREREKEREGGRERDQVNLCITTQPILLYNISTLS